MTLDFVELHPRSVKPGMLLAGDRLNDEVTSVTQGPTWTHGNNGWIIRYANPDGTTGEVYAGDYAEARVRIRMAAYEF